MENRPLPYGGDAAVAHSIRDAHTHEFWRPDICRVCGEHWPCRDRRQANWALQIVEADQRRYTRQQWGLVAAVALLLLIVPAVLTYRVLVG